MVVIVFDATFALRVAPARIGVGVTLEIGRELKKLDAKKALIVTGKTVGKSEICERVAESIRSEGIEVDVWDGVEPEPSKDVVEEGIKYAKGYDAFVAVGGGSSMDTAKLINLYTTYPADLYEYIPKPVGKGKAVTKPLKPLIAVPTTSGSGSETTCAAVMSLPELGLKVGILHEPMLPTLAIIDPLNMVSAPPSVTANAGMDALMHAIEAYTTKPYTANPNKLIYSGSNPLTDSFAERAIELIGKYLRRAVYNGHDIEARLGMAIAAYSAGIAFGNAGVHVPHAVAHAIGGKKKIPHGTCVSVAAPAILEFILPAVPEKLVRIAELLGESCEGSIHNAAKKAPGALKRLMDDIGIPSLGDLGFSEQDIPELVEKTLLLQRLLLLCPRNVTREDLEEILRKSFLES